MDQSTRIVLLDNGSLRPEAVRSLRRLAEALGCRLGCEVQPVSLLHSSKISPELLDGRPALTWRRFLRGAVEEGGRRFLVMPLFFGPSSAIVDYLPKVCAEALEGRSDVAVEVADTLVDRSGKDDSVARLLCDLLLPCLDEAGVAASPPAVVLVDHGSPLREVAEARDLVGRQMELILGDSAKFVLAASMERRDGEEYAFNEPLLESALERLCGAGIERAVLSLMFLSPGRHAGPGGDIERIVAESAWARTGRPLPFAPLVGESPALIDLLARRFAALQSRVGG